MRHISRWSHRVLLLALAPLLAGCPVTPTEVQDFPNAEVECTVSRISDGDTFSCVQKGRRVRLLGIDTPESSQWMGSLAKETLRSLLPVGSQVKVVIGAVPTDEFGRTLAWVYSTDGTFVNEQMVRLGYADLFRASSDRRYEGSFQAWLAEAQGFQRGLWALGFSACLPIDFKRSGQDCPRP